MSVLYKGKVFPTRELSIIVDGDVRNITVAPDTLSKAFGPEPDKWDDAAVAIDETLYFYMDPRYWNRSDEEIARDHLDDEFELAVLEEEY